MTGARLYRGQAEGPVQVLIAPPEQQVGIDVVLTGDQHHGSARLERLFGKLSLELHWKIGPLTATSGAAPTQ